jgi:hypothetical protein
MRFKIYFSRQRMKSTSLKNLNHIPRKKKESLKNNSRASFLRFSTSMAAVVRCGSGWQQGTVSLN